MMCCGCLAGVCAPVPLFPECVGGVYARPLHVLYSVGSQPACGSRNIVHIPFLFHSHACTCAEMLVGFHLSRWGYRAMSARLAGGGMLSRPSTSWCG
jgi:hypothetical protein